jgi:hypothetical protein
MPGCWCKPSAAERHTCDCRRFANRPAESAYSHCTAAPSAGQLLHVSCPVTPSPISARRLARDLNAATEIFPCCHRRQFDRQLLTILCGTLMDSGPQSSVPKARNVKARHVSAGETEDKKNGVPQGRHTKSQRPVVGQFANDHPIENHVIPSCFCEGPLRRIELCMLLPEVIFPQITTGVARRNKDPSAFAALHVGMHVLCGYTLPSN